jgi:HEAT repeat protein
VNAGDERAVQDLINALEPDERAAVFAIWAEELARGWIPKRPDLEAALHVVRGELP